MSFVLCMHVVDSSFTKNIIKILFIKNIAIAITALYLVIIFKIVNIYKNYVFIKYNNNKLCLY